MPKISWELPIRTVSEANTSEHWTKKSKRHQQQQFFVRLAYQTHVQHIELPCQVTMTRLATRMLDDDNLRIAMKWIRDEISECILPEKCLTYVTVKGKTRTIKGRADDDPRITWCYSQQKHPICALRIEIDY